MVTIFKRIDQKEDFDFILQSFLKREHVESERQWIELYCQINHVQEDSAYSKLSKELTTFFLIKEMDNNDYFEELKKKIGDTSCLCMNYEEIFYEPSFASNIEREFIKINKIDYDPQEGFLFVAGVTKRANPDVYIFLTLKEHADKVASGFMPMRKKDVQDKDEYEEKQNIMMTIWNDKDQRIPFVDKQNLKLKYV